MRFTVEQAGPEWGQDIRLARACEHAELTPHQAEAARRTAVGETFGEIGHALGLSYRSARRLCLKAARLLYRTLHEEKSYRWRFARDVLACIKNVAPRSHASIPKIYAPIPGGYSSTPVTLRARQEGECAEDLVRPWELLKFLRELPWLLCAVESEQQSSQCAVG